MRIFDNCTEMFEETFRELSKRGQHVFDKTVQSKIVSEAKYEQKEIIGYNYMLTNFDDLDEMMILAKKKFQKEHLTPEIAHAWFNDMISNDSLKESWWDKTEYSKDYYKKFCDEGGGNSSYSYGERVVPKLNAIIKRLKGNIYSRGAFLNVWDSKDVDRVGRRTPCTTGYHFLARDTIDGVKLNLILLQRSCDMINFFTLDLYKGCLLLKYIAEKVGVKYGYVIHMADSLHIYKKDIPEEYTW